MSTAQHVDPGVSRPAALRPWIGSRPLSIRAADARIAWRRSRPLIVAIALRVIPGPLKISAYAWSFGYALLGRRQAILALVMLWLFNMFTHAFGFPPSGAAIFRHLTVLAAALSVFVIHAAVPPRSSTPLLLLWTGGLNLLLLMHSLFISAAPEISTGKSLTYVLVIQTLLTAWSRLAPQERAVTEKQVWGVFFGLALLSAPLMFSSRGYYKNGYGFQGFLEHPQAFGPFMALLAVWLFSTWLTDKRMPRMLQALLVLAMAYVYLAKARGGMVMLAVGILVAIISRPLTVLINRSALVPRLLKSRLAFLVFSIAVVLAVAGPFLATEAQRFFLKQAGKSETIKEAFWESRGFLVEMMQQNIREHPMTGIGFGVASTPDGYSVLARDPVFGFVIMAAVEKGVLPVAIVEELGWPLALLFAPWFLGLFIQAIRAGPRYAGVCAAALTLNFSECVFFSPGGGGLIVEVLVAMAATAPPATQDRSLAMRQA